MHAATFDRLAGLFGYPCGAATCTIQKCGADPVDDASEAAKALTDFAAAMADLSFEQQQELFVRTFDLNPLCSLEVGWQLYGDHYERGQFLAQMRGHLRQFSIAESLELPDHLSHVLELLGRMPEDQFAAMAKAVQPAVEKMHASLQETDNPYRHLLLATRAAIGCLAGNTHQEVHP